MITWGMVGNSHDASLAVFDDDRLLWASLAKDFSGISNDPNFNWTQLEVARQSYGPPSKVIWYERPLLKTLRQWRAGQGWLLEENNIKKYLQRWGIDCKIEYTQHHESHAAYAYYTQPHDDCAIICLDSIGEFETLTIWHGKNGKLKKIYSQGYPHSLGLFYSAMTQRLGLVPQRDEYLVAQMGEKGDPHKFIDILRQDIINFKYGSPKITLKENLHRGCRWWMPEILENDYNNLAASVQLIFEYCIVNLSHYTKKQTGSENLALAGGGALNRQAVDNISKQWNHVWVPKNPGDPGSCIGAVLAKRQTFVDISKVWY